jgi:hypothetical protein
MPIYEYHCPANGTRLEVLHGINESPQSWGELCQIAGIELGDTDSEAAVERLVSAPSLSFPKGNSQLRDMGFTKLVKREKGVYENVTAREGESRYMNADNPKTYPKFKKTIGD